MVAFAFILLLAFTYANASPILIGAFNIQIFGQAKMDEPEVVDILIKGGPVPVLDLQMKVTPDASCPCGSGDSQTADFIAFGRFFRFNMRGMTEDLASPSTSVRMIVQRYDIVVIQEIRDSAETALPELVDRVNEVSRVHYDFIVSERTGRTSSKEQYGYVFRSNVVEVVDSYQYPDNRDIFEREPFTVKFKRINGGNQQYFSYTALHAKPDDAVAEIDALVEVYDIVEDIFGSRNPFFLCVFARSQYEYIFESPKPVEAKLLRLENCLADFSKSEDAGRLLPIPDVLSQDVLIAGDFNADCSYVCSSCWNQIGLWTDPRFTWLIDSYADTTVSKTDCAYDRLVVAGSSMTANSSGPKVFRYDLEYQLSSDEALDVSDHYPVEFYLE